MIINNKKIIGYMLKIISVLFTLLLLCFLFANIIGLRGSLFAFIIPCLLLILALVFRRLYPLISTIVQKHTKIVFIFAIILSLLVRLSFLFFDYAPESDVYSFVAAANNLIASGHFDSSSQYIASFPYLAPYSILLALFIKIFKNISLSTILLNILFDSIATIFIYFLTKKISHSAKLSLFMAALWVINPISVFFTPLSLPVIAVNAGIVVTLFACYSWYCQISQKKKYNNWKILGSSIAVGIIAGLANAFRPIMIIFIIALLIFEIMHIIKDKKVLTYLVPTLVVMLSFFGVGIIHNNIVSGLTRLPIVSNSSSWSIYVGANLESNGQWNQKDADYRDALIANNGDLNLVSDILMSDAVDRIHNMSCTQLISLLINKAFVLTGSQKHIFYNLSSYPQLQHRAYLIDIASLYSIVYLILLICCTTIIMRKALSQKSMRLGFSHLIIIIVIGLFCASLLVEVSTRYFTPFYALLFMAMLSLYCDKQKAQQL